MGRAVLFLVLAALAWDTATANCRLPGKDVGWHSPDIIYKIEEDTVNEKVTETHIRESFDMIEANTCLKFIDYRSAGDKPVDVKIVGNTEHCRYLDGVLELGYCIEFRKTIIHETAHYLGLYHTNNRSDWREYIRILPGIDVNEIPEAECPSIPGVGYDYGSGMHHEMTGFAEPVDAGYASTMGQHVRFPFNDYYSINYLFNCAGKCAVQPDCKNGGYTHPKDCNKCMCNNYFVGDFCETPRNLIKLSCEEKKGHKFAIDVKADKSLRPNVVLFDDFFDRGDNTWDLIEAPENTKIQVEVFSQAGGFAKPPSVVCGMAALEINDSDLNNVGRMFCDNPMLDSVVHTYTAKTNRVGLHVEYAKQYFVEMSAKFTLLGC